MSFSLRWPLFALFTLASACSTGSVSASATDTTSAAPAADRPEGTFVSAIVPGSSPQACMQQVGKYDQAYVDAAPAEVQMKLGVTCAERGFTRRDEALTKKMFDEPDRPGNGAFVKGE